jgi:GNAT superfamily N-acetyltransferase
VTTFRVRRAAPADGERLREVMAASKAHWGYERTRVDDWARGEDFSAARFGKREIYAAEVDGRLVAWFSLTPSTAGTCHLDDLWVEPSSIGRGVGRRLFEEASARARESNCSALEWDTDPNAQGFYERMGARVVGEVTSSWGRQLPVMRLELA